MLKKDFDYQLPPQLIAQQPIYPRDSSKLLYYNRNDDVIKDLNFYNIKDYLKKGDVLVINNTRVIQARIFAFNGERKFEILLLERIDLNTWQALLKPARKARIGTQLVVNEELKCVVADIIDNGVRIIKFEYDGVFEDILSRVGEVPLPPYITEKLIDKERYQTVYSKVNGSSAAPTAGLHFTEKLLQEIKEQGVEIAEVLLHVGLGTFRPVKCENIYEHKMHKEYFEVPMLTQNIINNAKKQNRRIIAVGTTSVRVLESAFDSDGRIKSDSGYTDIFIYPSYHFKVVDGLITNFHLPQSTLLMLVSAFADRERVMKLYQHAIIKNYRFFSFGDAMMIL